MTFQEGKSYVAYFDPEDEIMNLRFKILMHRPELSGGLSEVMTRDVYLICFDEEDHQEIMDDWGWKTIPLHLYHDYNSHSEGLVFKDTFSFSNKIKVHNIVKEL